jgi:hypothetical protein
VLALALSPGARAQESSPDPVLPDAGSPPDALYQIPLDTARRDAAPHPGRKEESTAPDRSGSSIRSENGFGSSTKVPLEPAPDPAGQATKPKKATGKPRKKTRRTDTRPRKTRREQQTPVATAGQSLAALAGGDDPSEGGTYLLLGLTILTAAFGGFVATRAARRSRR